jgi:RNA polymerase sigma factor for flagellar operon FliA
MPQGSLQQKEESLWRQHRDEGDPSSRSRLIEFYLPLVRRVAATFFARRADEQIEFDDYFQLGVLGLLESVDRYDFCRDAAFETFATYRIRGSILNGLEKMTEKRDQYAFRSRYLKERVENIALKNDDEEEDLFTELVDAALGIAIGYMLEDTGIVCAPEKVGDCNVYRTQELAELRERLVLSVAELPEREKFVIQSHYFSTIQIHNIAESLQVSKGRVSQLHKRALKLLREQIVENRALDGYF